ncbi:MAG: SMP-30/gluconolactonase/LRE family protein [Acidobacteria bacterium]|nr:SMP-30/gluconolactonase/LRE family protein [Acidobacteriota bacterium]
MSAWLALILAAATLPAQTYRVSTVAGRPAVDPSRPPLESSLETPAALAVDAASNLYIADAASNRVWKITPDLNQQGPERKYAFGTITLVAGAGGMFFDGDEGRATQAHLASPNGVAVAPDGTIYVADTNNNRIRAITTDGIIHTVASGLAIPFGVSVDAAGTVYFSELQSGRVRRIENDGSLTTLASQLVRPMGLAIAPDGALLIAESGSQRIQRLSSDGNIQVFAETGARSIPRSLTVDAEGIVYFSDVGTGNIQRIDPAGSMRPVLSIILPNPMGLAATAEGTLFFSTTGTFGGAINMLPAGQASLGSPIAGGNNRGREGIPALESLVMSPTGVARKPDGTLLIAQPLQDVIRKVDDTGLIRLYAGNSPGFGGDGGPVERASLSNTFAVATDAAGNVFLADSSNMRIRKVDTGGIITTLAAGLTQPQQVSVDNAGNVYAGEPLQHRIRIIAPDGSVRTLAGNGTRGFSGDNGPATEAQLASPQGSAADNEGNVYIADTGNNRIRRVKADGTIETIATITAPQGLAIDSTGALLITAGHAIHRLKGSTLERIAGGAEPGFSGDDEPAIDSRWNQPSAIYAAPDGDIFIADRGNHRVRRLRPYSE